MVLFVYNDAKTIAVWKYTKKTLQPIATMDKTDMGMYDDWDTILVRCSVPLRVYLYITITTIAIAIHRKQFVFN